MGGTLPFTLRRKGGKEYRMSRWTNWMPWAIDNVKMVEKNTAHVNNVIKQWVDEQKKPKKQRHWAYNSPYLAPYSYGLVVVDMMKNKILDCNGYHAFGKIAGVNLSNEITDRTDLMRVLNNDSYECFRFFEFYKAGRIKEVKKWKLGEDTLIDENVNEWPIEKIFKELIFVNDSYIDFVFDMSPFEVIRFPETSQGWKDYHQTVLDLGFKLTRTEEKMWLAKINNNDEE